MSDASRSRKEALLHLRAQFFEQLAEAEQQCAQLRVQAERLESDCRIGLPPTAEYQELKGHTLPRAETRIMDLHRDIVKLEAKLAPFFR